MFFFSIRLEDIEHDCVSASSLILLPCAPYILVKGKLKLSSFIHVQCSFMPLGLCTIALAATVSPTFFNCLLTSYLTFKTLPCLTFKAVLIISFFIPPLITLYCNHVCTSLSSLLSMKAEFMSH